MAVNHWKRDHALTTAIANVPLTLYLLCMGTGILAVNLQVLPYQFKGLSIISIIIWIFDLILYTLINIGFITRYIMFPSSTIKSIEDDPEQATYLSTVAISTSTIIEMTAMVLGKTWQGWDTAVMVLWYCSVVMALIAALVPYWIMFRLEHVGVETLPPTAMYPATAILATAASGSAVVTYSSLSIRASQPIVIISYMLLGMGFLLALSIIANYTGRLLQAQTPPPKKAMASFVPIAALANAAYTADALGKLVGPSRQIFLEYGRGTTANIMMTDAMYAVGVLICLCLQGFAIFWLLLSIFVVAHDIHKAPFTLNYWSALYPLGVFALTFGQLASDFNSPTFRTCNTIVTCCLLLLWIYNIVMTIPRVITGEIFLKDITEMREKRESWNDRHRLRDVVAESS